MKTDRDSNRERDVPHNNDRSVVRGVQDCAGCELLLGTLDVVFNDGTLDHENLEKAVGETGTR